MKKILGLDISSSVIGWATLEYDKNNIELKEYGHIKPPDAKSGSLSFRATRAMSELKKILATQKPDIVTVENYASSFTPGRTTARTIIVLCTFNEITQYVILEALGFESEKLAVSHIRSVISKYVGVKSISKDDIFEEIKKAFPAFIPRITKKGTIGTESFDQADAIAVAFCYAIENQNK